MIDHVTIRKGLSRRVAGGGTWKNVPPSRNSGKLCMHVFTFNLGPMSGPLTGKARSLTQLQAVIRVRMVREPSGEAGSE